MNVLLINGSPHAHGCTDAALQEIAKALNADGIETTIYHIGAVPVGGCVGCGGCAKAGHCVFGGPVVDVLPLVEKADGKEVFPNLQEEYGYVYGCNGYGSEEAEYLFPYLESYPAEMWLAPVEEGQADMTKAVRVR